jgi:hypothetical protein
MLKIKAKIINVLNPCSLRGLKIQASPKKKV